VNIIPGPDLRNNKDKRLAVDQSQRSWASGLTGCRRGEALALDSVSSPVSVSTPAYAGRRLLLWWEIWEKSESPCR
jgi:hypothetical protein